MPGEGKALRSQSAEAGLGYEDDAGLVRLYEEWAGVNMKRLSGSYPSCERKSAGVKMGRGASR